MYSKSRANITFLHKILCIIHFMDIFAIVTITDMKDLSKEEKDIISESYKRLKRNRYALFVDLIEPSDLDYGIKPLIIKVEKILKIKIEYNSFRAWIYKVYNKRQKAREPTQSQENDLPNRDNKWNIIEPKTDHSKGSIVIEQIKSKK